MLDVKWTQKFTQQQEQLDQQKESLSQLQTALQQLREEVAELRKERDGGDDGHSVAGSRMSTGSGGASRSPASKRGDFEPRRLFARGFAPWGCDAKQKLSRSETEEIQKAWIAKLPANLRTMVEPGGTYALNHQIEWNVTGGRVNCTSVQSFWTDLLAREMLPSADRTGWRVAIEISPERRSACRAFFAAVDWLKSKGIVEDRLVTCQRSLRLYTRSYSDVGMVVFPANTWKWCAEGLTELGLPAEGSS